MLKSFRDAVQRNWGHIVSAVAAVLTVGAVVAAAIGTDLAGVVALLAVALVLLSFGLAHQRGLHTDRVLRRLEPRIRSTQVSVRDLQRKDRALLRSVKASSGEVRSAISQVDGAVKRAASQSQASADQLGNALTDVEGRRRLDETMRESEHQQANDTVLKNVQEMAARLDEAVEAIRRIEDRMAALDDHDNDDRDDDVTR